MKSLGQMHILCTNGLLFVCVWLKYNFSSNYFPEAISLYLTFLRFPFPIPHDSACHVLAKCILVFVKCQQLWRCIKWWSLKTKSLLFTPFAELTRPTFFFFPFLMVIHRLEWWKRLPETWVYFQCFQNVCWYVCSCSWLLWLVFMCIRRQG